MSNPVKPSTLKGFVPSVTAKVCDALTKALLAFPAAIYQFYKWAWTDGGEATTEYKTAVNWMQSGDYLFTATALARTGFLLCNGQAVNRTTYADLYAAIGDTYGAGDGSTTFNLPDWRDRFPVGAGSTYALGSKGGASTVKLTTSQLAPHQHFVAKNSQTNGATGLTTDESVAHIGGGNGQENYILQPHADAANVGLSSETGGDGTGEAEGHNNIPPYMGLYVYIKT